MSRLRLAASIVGTLATCFYPTASTAATPAETVVVTEEMAFTGRDTMKGDFASPVTTYKGSIYTVWVDPQDRTMIAKKSPEGAVTTRVIFQETDHDPYHNGPSVGVDRDGYIHVAGNMHNSPFGHPDTGNPYYEHAWQYVVSDEPEDIGSFTFYGSDPQRSPPGTWISYPFFARDHDGVLFLGFRHRVLLNTAWIPGIMAGGVARYDADAQSWAMLGGTDYVHDTKTTFWTDKPDGGDAYEPYKPRIYFDGNNRMHVAVTVQDDGVGNIGPTHVIYAYSDDGGNTFFKADGSPIASLPITLDNGDLPFDRAWMVSGGRSANSCNVAATEDGRPIVTLSKSQVRYWTFWQAGSGWSPPQSFTATFPGRLAVDPTGITTTMGYGQLHRTFDYGATWRTYSVESGNNTSYIFDHRYHGDTFQTRYQTFTEVNGGPVQVFTAHFSGTAQPVGTVPAGGAGVLPPLVLAKAPGDELTLTWSPACIPSDDDYAIYEGSIGDFTSHTALTCSTGGILTSTFEPGGIDRYYLVVPQGGTVEGGYGLDSAGNPRSPGVSSCRPRLLGDCPP